MENNIQFKDGQYDKMIWSIVHKLLTKLYDNYYYNGLENDLFQEGYMALMMAAEKYDEELGVQFSTFAYKYICGCCLNYLKKECLSLRNEDIENSPTLSEKSYMDEYSDCEIIEEIDNRLKLLNKSIPDLEKAILEDRLCKDYSLQKCAELNKCSIKKVSNIINKYKDIIRNILDEGRF